MSGTLQNNFTVGNPNPRDMSKPIIVPYVRKEYPKMMYHPTRKTNQSIVARQKAELHNQLHPGTPDLVPELLPVITVVNSIEEENAQLKQGFQLKPPASEAEMTEEEIETQPEPVLHCDFCGEKAHKGRCKKVSA